MSRRILWLSIGAVLVASIALFYSPGGSPPVADDTHQRKSATQVKDPLIPSKAADNSLRSEASLRSGSPDQWIEDALRTLPSLRESERHAAVAKLIAELRAAGPRGLKAIADFLSSNRDVELGAGYGMSGNRVTFASTLRVALVNALARWEGSAGILLEFLRSPASGWEIVLAIRNLELEFPNTYRAEATAALQRALARPAETNFGEGGEIHVFATVARLGASQLLPKAETLAVTTSNVPRYLETLAAFPAEIRDAARARVLARPEVTDEIVAAPQTLNFWSFEDPQTRAFVVGVFRGRLEPEQCVAMLDGFGASAPIIPVEQRLFSTPQNAREADLAANAAAVREAQGRKAFLIEVAADKKQSPEIQAAAKDAQLRITEEIAAQQVATRADANPLVEVDFAQGDGRAQIKGRRIEQIELKAPAVTEPPLATDSTEPLPR